VLGNHVEQKGSLVTWEKLRFDFSHFSKMTPEEVVKVEKLVNKYIRENYQLTVFNNVPFDKAKNMGAIALFGEKYGDAVRVVKFGDSIELCGGTHTTATGNIGIFKIVSESSVSAGIRRIEAVTGEIAEEYINSIINEAGEVSQMLRSTGKIADNVKKLISDNAQLRKRIEKLQIQLAEIQKKKLEARTVTMNGFRFIKGVVEAESPEMLKTIANLFRNSNDDVVLAAGSVIKNKAHIVVMVSDNLVSAKNISAVEIIKAISPLIEGEGGGQPFLATAGGKKVSGLHEALSLVESWLKNK